MARFSADTLDLARLPPPQAIQTLDYEVILAARLVDLTARLQANGIAYDVGGLETDPLKILEEADAYRELLDLGAINDAVRAVMLPLATGADLDNLGAFYHCDRLPLVASPRGNSVDFPDDWEQDDRYRYRVLLAPEAFSCAGSIGGYIFHTLTADVLVKDAGLRLVEPGVIEIAVLSSLGDGTPSSAMLANVSARLHRIDIKPFTDVVSVVAAMLARYAVAGTVYVPPGPDPAVVKAQAEAAIDMAAANAQRVGLKLYSDTFLAALRVGPARHAVLDSPAGELGGPGQAPTMTGRTVTVTVLDE